MRLFDLPSGETVDLDEIAGIGKLFVNKNYPQYTCYEVFAKSGASYSVFEADIPRETFLQHWRGEG